MKKPKLFVTQPIEESALKRLQSEMGVTVHPDSSRSIIKPDLIEGLRKNDYLFCRLGDVVDAEAMDANPDLKLIATMATEAAQIDLAEATRRKIPVIARKIPDMDEATPDSVIEETADLAWTLLMSLDVFEGEPHPILPQELTAMKNVVLTPHLGSAVAEKREIMANSVADIILAFLEGKIQGQFLNPEILE